MFNNIILSVMAWKSSTIGLFVTRVREERGQDLMEYAVLAGGIAILLIAALLAIDASGAYDLFAGRIESCITFDLEGCQG